VGTSSPLLLELTELLLGDEDDGRDEKHQPCQDADGDLTAKIFGYQGRRQNAQRHEPKVHHEHAPYPSAVLILGDFHHQGLVQRPSAGVSQAEKNHESQGNSIYREYGYQ